MKTLKLISLLLGYFVCKVLPILVVLGVIAYVFVMSFMYGDVSLSFAIKDIMRNGVF